MDLFTSAEKIELAAIMDNVADTFSRPIVVISAPNRTIISTNQNPLFAYPRQLDEVEFEINSVTINARILHGKPKDTNLSERTKYNDVNIDIPEGQVRIKIKSSDYDILKNAKRITLDGADYIVDSHSRGHGLFDVNYYTFYLKPENSD